MKYIPILFSTDMVQSNIKGNKTKTRRTKGLDLINKNPDDYQFEWADFSLKNPWRFTQLSSVNKETLRDKTFIQEALKCPYGNPGDILWVKETFTIIDWWEEIKLVQIMYEDAKTKVITLTDEEWGKFDKWAEKSVRRPSLFLFKSLSRIHLKIEKISVQRLNDITEEDAISEGVEKDGMFYKNYITGLSVGCSTAKASFFTLWEKINGRDSLVLNPWVWVVGYNQIDKPEQDLINY